MKAFNIYNNANEFLLYFHCDSDFFTRFLFKVFSIEHIRIFNEEELERMFCGESDSWAVSTVSFIKLFL